MSLGCWGEHIDYCRFISMYKPASPVQDGCSVGRPGWPMDAPAAADQLPGLNAAIWLMRKGDAQEATREILDATLAHSRSLGSDHGLCNAGLCFLFLVHAADIN